MGLEELHKPAFALTSLVSVLKPQKLWLLKVIGSRRGPYLIPSNTSYAQYALYASASPDPRLTNVERNEDP